MWRGRAVRLALLLATLVGLTAMHTLGHSGTHLPAGHHHHEHAVTAAAGMLASAADRPSGDLGAMTGWDVCVAILVAFAVMLLAAVLRRASLRAYGAATRNVTAGRTGPRAPPDRPVGLTLATVSVLRT
jgi:hypothetical protein